MFLKKPGAFWFLILLTLFRAMWMWFYKYDRGPTTDEPHNLLAIQEWFKSAGAIRIRPQTMPVHFPLIWLKDWLSIPYEAAAIAVNSLQVPLFYGISKILFSNSVVCLFLTILFAMEPNVLAHSMLPFTMDAYLTTHTLLIFWVLFKFKDSTSAYISTLVGFVVGLTLCVKLTGAFYLPLFGILWLLLKNKNHFRIFVFYCLGAWVGICAGYGFQELLAPLNTYNFYSEAFIRLQATHPQLILPAPKQLIRSLDHTLFFDKEKHEEWIYILGKVFNAKPVWYYFLICFLFKLPLTSLLAPILSFVKLARDKTHRLSRTSPWVTICAFALILFYLCSFKLNMQLGIRYILPLVPLFILPLGMLRWTRNKMIVVLVYSFLSLAYNYTNLIGYFNEFAPLKHRRYLILSDSNLSWNDLHQRFLNHLNKLPEADSTGQLRPVFNPETIPSDRDFYLEANGLLNLIIGCPTCNDVRAIAKPYEAWGEGAYLRFHPIPNSAELLKNLKN